MPITVEHGNGVDTTLAMLLGQLQGNQRAQDEQDQLYAMLNDLATQAMQPIPQPGDPPIEPIPSRYQGHRERAVRPQAEPSYGERVQPEPERPSYYMPGRPRGSYAGTPRQRAANPIISLTGNGAGNNSLLLQQMRGQQDAAEQEARAAQQMDLEAMRQANDPMAKTPEWIQKGVVDGSLRYTPANRQRYNELRNFRTKVLMERRFSAAEKAMAIANIDAEMQQLQMDVEETPANEKPLTPQQQFEQNIVTLTGPDGRKRQYFLGQRSGNINPIPLDDDTEKLQAQQQKQSEADAKLYRQQVSDEQKIQTQKQLAYNTAMSSYHKTRNEMERDLAKAKMDLAAAKLKDAADRAKAKAEVTVNDYVEPPPTDWSSYEQYIKILESQKNGLRPPDALDSGIPATDSLPPIQPMAPAMPPAPGSAPPVMPSQTAPPQPSVSQPSPEAEVTPVTGDDGVVRILVGSREELERLPVGTPFILPDGRTGTRQ